MGHLRLLAWRRSCRRPGRGRMARAVSCRAAPASCSPSSTRAASPRWGRSDPTDSLAYAKDTTRILRYIWL